MSPRGTESWPSVGTEPRVLVVGGVDVDQRLELMLELRERYDLAAAGSGDLKARFEANGFPYFRYPLSRGLSPAADARSFLILRRMFRRLKPDLVHTFSTKPSVWGRLAASSVGVPVVIGTIPGLGSLFSSQRRGIKALRHLYVAGIKRAARRSDLTILQNQTDADELIAAGVLSADRTTVIAGSGIRTDLLSVDQLPTDLRQRTRRELGISASSVVVTMVSRLIKPKGVLEYAAAADRLSGIDAVFLLVGPNDTDSLDRLGSRELKLVSELVRWLGERDDVPSILAASDIFAFPSYYREGIPRVLLEAASLGLPLIAARTAGSEDVVADRINGLLVQPRDLESLVEALQELIQSPELRSRFGSRSRRRVVERFDLTVVAAQIADHYDGLLKRVRADRKSP